MSKFVERWSVVVLCLVAWEMLPALGIADSFFISSPSLVAMQLIDWTLSGTIFRHIAVTFAEAALGFVLGTVAGIAVGLWCGLDQRVSNALLPLAAIGNALPKLAFAPLLVTWFGFGLSSKVALAAVVVFFFVFFGVYSGIRSGDGLIVANSRVLGGKGWSLVLHVHLPSALSWLMASLRLSIAYSFAAAVVGEYLGATEGLGFLMIYGMSMLDLTSVFSALVVVGALVGGFDIMLARVARSGSHWRTTENADGQTA